MRKKKSNKIAYSQKQVDNLQDSITLEKGFLIKSNTIIGLITSEIIQTANEGFLHVEETTKYETE